MARKRTPKDNITPFPAPPQPDPQAREWAGLTVAALAAGLPAWATEPLKAYVQIETPKRYWEAWCGDYQPLVPPGSFIPFGIRLLHVLENTSYTVKDATGKEQTIYQRTYWPSIEIIGGVVLFYPMVVELPEIGHQGSEPPPTPPEGD